MKKKTLVWIAVGCMVGGLLTGLLPVFIIGMILGAGLLIAAPLPYLVKRREVWLEKQNEKNRQYEADHRIVSVKYLGGGTIQEKKYGMKGFLVGGFFGGVPGALVGSVLPSGKQRQKQKFAVKYGDGRVRIVECFKSSSTYDELMKHVSWEEL